VRHVFRRHREACLLDTGSAWTILNPAEGCTDTTDPVFAGFQVVGPLSLVIRGNRGAMPARKGSSSRWGGEGSALREHTPHYLANTLRGDSGETTMIGD